MSIVFKNTQKDLLKPGFLYGFDRYQVTTHVKYVNGGVLDVKENHFTEEWSKAKLDSITRFLKHTVSEGGVLITANDSDQIVGFACLQPNIFFKEYINLPYFHITRSHRRKGIGKAMFERICEEARKLGAKKLYISSHPSLETQAFYENMGCVLTKRINRQLLSIEPLDIHLEKTL